MATVTFDHVWKKFGDVVAVNDLNLEIQDGEFMVLVGPSGCGKTTSLRMIAGLEEATSGEIYIGDQLVNDVPPKDRDIAMVFQNYALYPHVTVYENMSFGLRVKKVPKDEIERRVQNAARILDISELLSRKPKQLSGGQRQRVTIAAAIAASPSILIADEATSALDTVSQAAIATLLDDLVRQENKTLVFITHDMGIVAETADRVVVMLKGKKVEEGATASLFHAPTHPYSRALLAAVPRLGAMRDEVRAGVLVRDDFSHRQHQCVAAGVVVVLMRVDDIAQRLRGDLLDLGDGLRRIQALRAGLGAVHAGLK